MFRRFQARVFLMIAVVALAATGATAWLTVRTTRAELSSSGAEERRTTRTIYDTLRSYGADHGTWEGVAETVERLGRDTGQRIRLVVSQDGTVIADTDTMEGRTARAVPNKPAVAIDVRPLPVLDGTALLLGKVGLSDQIRQYRDGVRFAACLTRHDVPVRLAAGTFVAASDAPGKTVKECLVRGLSSPGELDRDKQAVAGCEDDPCMRDAYTRRISEFAPAALQLQTGWLRSDQGPPEVSPKRTLAAAGVVALLAIAATVLLCRRVLGQLDALSHASRKLAGGDLSERVPVRGDDEVADLARSFNQMADSLQHSEERQRRMISDIAHELRTPLANIRGYVEAVQDGLLEPDAELFASLHEEALLQQRLIDDLQELALAESGSLVYHRDRLDPAELLTTCHASHRAVAEAGSVRLVLDPGDPPPVDADPDRLRQVVGNLITNAVRAAASTVVLQASADGDLALITVTDDGHGISPGDLPHMFDRFWRADESRARTTGGRGLGLAISREIVLAHGGEITVTSVLGEGTCFAVRLPSARAAATAER
ncbi:HAMP domain-containing sensor histidine kinase [Actinocorallia longicatena]|uniref:histidine kinase n=1 Tax=Actinocorallia longicatena TaxID=111803 RepID=A0ABP6QL44_9ACTN